MNRAVVGLPRQDKELVECQLLKNSDRLTRKQPNRTLTKLTWLHVSETARNFEVVIVCVVGGVSRQFISRHVTKLTRSCLYAWIALGSLLMNHINSYVSLCSAS